AQPTAVPVAQPTATPVQAQPTAVPAAQPTATPVQAQPTAVPVAQPTATPVQAQPTAVPVAQPTATPVQAQPTAVPVAQPTATPVQAQPTAVPVAQPTATPVQAKPTAVPVAQPTATSVQAQLTAVPVAQPTATPVQAKPTAVPAAQPTATPVQAKPTAVPVAQPTATPVQAKPAAVPTAQPTATPVQAKPTATPVTARAATPTPAQPQATPATPVPVATPTAPPVATPSPVAAQPQAPDELASLDEEIFGSDELLNKKVGNYNIVWKIGDSRWGPVYVAVQTSMARPVAMKVLAESVQRNDPTAKERFTAMARAKAAVKHPSIISVYEAGEASGHTYFTHEYIDGMHLAEAKEKGHLIDDPVALRILKVVAEGFAYLQHHKIAHVPLEGKRIYLGKDNAPHLANVATIDGEGGSDFRSDLTALATAVCALLPNGEAKDSGLKALFARMLAGGDGGFQSWGAFQQAIKALEPKVIPADALKLTAQEQAAIRAIEEAKKQQKRAVIMTTAGLFVLLWIVGGLIYLKFFHSNERPLNEMVHIPAGEFIYQNGEKRTTGEFWIDKYEVTIGQYARFLAYLEQNPTTEFDHPDQPPGKSHIPGGNKKQWETYYGRARVGKPARYVPIDLNSPIFNVDYWDAWAYAKWANKRLPTEVEWEKAARGTKGRIYPWGDKYDPKLVNSGNDYDPNPNPHSNGKVDGHFWWSPVDAMMTDVSSYGVIGMGGNVAEWTEGENKKAVVRGGSFKRPDTRMTHRVTDGLEPELTVEFLGFRCVSDTPPNK
ncbi:MAG TPA: SUMF1/EgtB/PvdO family nonheme iron enzyme, partial [Chthoniobacteraceae bacterium]|nr:SUMF1/EgtB/PvdO family nonheme iron enzyme [Chthoniobacteraceae bacterium]